MKKDEIIVRNLDYFTPNDGIEYYYLQIQVHKIGADFVILKENTYNADETEILFTSTSIFDTTDKWKKIRLDNNKWF